MGNWLSINIKTQCVCMMKKRQQEMGSSWDTLHYYGYQKLRLTLWNKKNIKTMSKSFLSSYPNTGANRVALTAVSEALSQACNAIYMGAAHCAVSLPDSQNLLTYLLTYYSFVTAIWQVKAVTFGHPCQWCCYSANFRPGIQNIKKIQWSQIVW